MRAAESSSRGFAPVLAAAWLLVPALAFAQNTEDQNNFDFSLPGARSRGIGGAFVAVADDATSVYSNPAGLTLLFRPEVSAEGRFWHLTSRTIDRGHGFGSATGRGADNIDGFVDKDFESNVAGLSFLSFVYPRERWAVGVFRHQLARYEMERQIEGAFFDCSGGFRNPVDPSQGTPPFCEPHAATDGVDREFPKRQSIDLGIHSTGAAVGYKVSERLSAGVALQFFEFSLIATNKVFSAEGDQKYLAPNFTDPDNIFGTSTQSGEDHAWAMNAGALWNVTRDLVVGGSFRQGPRFTFATQLVSGPRTGNRGVVGGQPDNPFHVPDTFGVGAAQRVAEFWRFMFEYDWINYHQLIDDFRNTAVDSSSPEAALVVEGARIDNAHQFRGGGERLVLLSGGRVLALRGGVWYDPNHQTYFDADPATGLPAPRWAVLLPKRSGAWHGSAGFGVTMRRHLQIDAAIDLSDLIDTFAISTVWRF